MLFSIHGLPWLPPFRLLCPLVVPQPSSGVSFLLSLVILRWPLVWLKFVTFTPLLVVSTTGLLFFLLPRWLLYVFHATCQLENWLMFHQAISWVCGWFAASGWVALAATAGSLAGQLITGVIGLMHPNYNPERWHIFLIYIAYTLGACFLNIFGLRLLPMINQTAIFW